MPNRWLIKILKIFLKLNNAKTNALLLIQNYVTFKVNPKFSLFI